jgi:hypothetical protein
MDQHPSTDALRTLLGKLWVERHTLELLAYKLTCAKLIMAGDIRRYVAPALAGVEHVVDKVRVAELDRSIALAQVADEWGVPISTLTLAYLAQNAPEPARTMFEEHQQSFRHLVAEIEETALENRKLATSSLRGIQAALDDLMRSEAGATYGATGHREAGPVPSHISKSL